MSFQIFIGAPTAKELRNTPTDTYGRWETFDSSYSHPHTQLQASRSISGLSLLPPATLEAASRRISLIYQNAIFQDDEDEEDMNESMDIDEPTHGLEGA